MAEEQQSRNTPTAPREQLSPDQGQVDRSGDELQRTKLELETQLLRRQLRPRFFWIELAKAVAAPVAVLGLIWTIYVGVGQLRESRRLRDEERFDKAVTRLAGSTATERLAGVAGLQLFLEPAQKNWHRPTLRFFVNALAS